MASKQFIRIRTSTLVQIAAGTFIAGTSVLYFLQRHMQGKVRALPHYKETFDIIAQHEKLLDTIGKPIQVGKVDLADRLHNYVDEKVSELRVPLSGPLDSGYLNVVATRNDSKDMFKTKKLTFETLDGTFVVYER